MPYKLDLYFKCRFSVTKTSNLERSNFWILVDDQRYAGHFLYTADVPPAGSATIILQLTAGQIVRVENQYSSIIYGTSSDGVILSWFTGHLLYPL